MKKAVALLILLCVVAFHGCGKYPVNPNYPNAMINITINLNQVDYYDLRVVSGYAYLTSDPLSTSRGIIVYRVSQEEFLAYDRLPPNEPNACTDSQGNTTRLVVESPYVVDHCNNAYYNILNGEILINEEFGMIPSFAVDSVPIYPLIQYHTSFNGYELHIYN